MFNRKPGLQGTGPKTADAQQTKSQADAAERLAKALGAVSADTRAALPSSWSERTTMELEKETLAVEQEGRKQGRTWQQVHQDMSAAAVKFWQSQVEQTKDGTKNREEAQRKLLSAQEQLDMLSIKSTTAAAKKSAEEVLAGYHAQEAEAHGNLAALQAIEAEKLSFVRRTWGESSKEYRTAQAEETNALRAAVGEQVRKVEEGAKQELAAVRVAEAAKLAARNTTKEQSLQDMADAMRRIDDSELATLDALMKHLDAGSAAYRVAMEARKKLAQDLATAEIAEQARADDAAQKVYDRQTREFEQSYSTIERSAAQTFTGMLNGTETFQRGAQRMMSSVVDSVVNLGEQMASKWLATQLMMTATTQTQAAVRTAQEAGGSGFSQLVGGLLAQWLGLETGKTAASTAGAAARSTLSYTAAAAAIAADGASALGQIKAASGVAGANAFAATAAIPIVGPELAPAAGAAAAAAALSYSALAVPSFDVGSWSLPADTLAMVHQGEMIIPADLASQVRGGGGGFPDSGLSGGDTHVHFNITTPDVGGFQSLIRTHGDDIARVVSQRMSMNPSIRPKF
jgi:hypothetical protein